MFFLVFGFFLQSFTGLFDGDYPSPELKQVIVLAKKIRPADKQICKKKDTAEYFQKKWLRRKGAERNVLDMPESLSVQRIKEFNQVLTTLGMFGSSKYGPKNPKVVVILGASFPSMKKRVSLICDYARTLKSKPLVILLTGDRALEKSRQDKNIPLDQGAPADCTTEESAGRYLAEQQRDIEIQVINSKKQPAAKRATTADNGRKLESELKQKNIQGEVLIISSEPVGPYQLASIKRYCNVSGIHFSLLSVPYSEPFDKKTIALCMDTLARWVYTETSPSDFFK